MKRILGLGASIAALGCVSAMAQVLPQQNPKAPLNLVCLGAATSTLTAGKPAQPLSARPGHEQRGQVDLWLDERNGRIHIPFDLFATGRTNGDWYELEKIAISEHQITAILASRLFGRPKIWISRIDGTMSISGRDRQFTGMCSRFDERSAPRRF